MMCHVSFYDAEDCWSMQRVLRAFVQRGEGTMCSQRLQVGERKPLNLRAQGHDICVCKWLLGQLDRTPEERFTIGATLAIQVARCT